MRQNLVDTSMKLADAIEASDEPLEVILPIDEVAEMQEAFRIYRPYDDTEV